MHIICIPQTHAPATFFYILNYYVMSRALYLGVQNVLGEEAQTESIWIYRYNLMMKKATLREFFYFRLRRFPLPAPRPTRSTQPRVSEAGFTLLMSANTKPPYQFFDGSISVVDNYQLSFLTIHRYSNESSMSFPVLFQLFSLIHSQWLFIAIIPNYPKWAYNLSSYEMKRFLRKINFLRLCILLIPIRNSSNTKSVQNKKGKKYVSNFQFFFLFFSETFLFFSETNFRNGCSHNSKFLRNQNYY